MASFTGLKNIGEDVLEYMMKHRPWPDEEMSAGLHDLDNVFPGIYGRHASDYKTYAADPRIDAQALKVINAVRGNPEAMVDIYRAVPKGVRDFNTGDWVSISKNYAKQHGKSALNGEYDLIKAKARAADISEPGDSIAEQGYWGNPVIGKLTRGMLPLFAAGGAAAALTPSEAEASPLSKYNNLLGKFADSLDYKDLPAGWADNPEIVQAAEELYRDMGTESPFFKAWFGNSKVVDDAGKPLATYHGTTEGGFDVFDTGGMGKTSGAGSFFSENPDVAMTYSGIRPGASGEKIEDFSPIIREDGVGVVDSEGDLITDGYKNVDELLDDYDLDEGEKIATIWRGISDNSSFGRSTFLSEEEALKAAQNETGIGNIPAKTYETYLSIKKPYVIDAKGSNWDNIFGESTDNIIKNNALNGKYDGSIIQNVRDEGIYGDPDYPTSATTFSVFNPEQIKATSNRGTFNPADPNIYKALPFAVGGAGAAAALAPEEAQAAQDNAGGGPSWKDEIKRGLGLGTRNVLEGLGDFSDTFLNQPINAVGRLFGYDMGLVNPGKELADAMGLPVPETDLEKRMAYWERGAASAVPEIVGGAGVAKMAASSVARGVGRELSSSPKRDIVISGLLGSFLGGE